jgi:hypothetical protein
MSNETYRIECSYLIELSDVVGVPYKHGEEAYCNVTIRFLDVPLGNGHCAFLSMTVVTTAKAAELGIGPEGRRAYLVADTMTQEDFRRRVTDDVTRAFDQLPRDQALAWLDKTYVCEYQDYQDEFRGDRIGVADLHMLIDHAFAGVTRGEGVTLHEALAADDYASPEDLAAARAQDTDVDWHDAPRELMSARCEFFSYLDPGGFRYYLPAAMLLSLDAAERDRSETPQRTYWSLLGPPIAPRDFGKGFGKTFDVEAFIARCEFTDAQVCAISRFLCFMAVDGDEGVNEEELPVLRRWRESLERRTRRA